MGLNKRLIGGAAAVVPTNTDNFDIVTYAGTNTTNSITSLDFQPDLVWIKNRDNANDHFLTDSVRGAGAYVQSNNSNAEDTTSRFNSFNSNGFTVSTDTALLNNTAYNYVAWCFKGGGSAVSNTDGDVTAQVSANPEAGFSIITYTGDGTNNASVGHGLNQAPEFFIYKRLSSTSDWPAAHKDNNSYQGYIVFNGTGSSTTDSAMQAPDSSVINFNTTSPTFNGSGQEWLIYAFHSVDGYQKVGSYTGDGNFAGPTVTTGFSPRFVMLKNASSSSRDSIDCDWYIFDTARDTGTLGKKLEASTNNAEEDISNNGVAILSDGFRIYRTAGDMNRSGDNYIYLAIA